MMTAWSRLAGLLFVLAFVLPGSNAVAHPLGNNTVSRQAVLEPDERRIALTYRMDLAEIPTLAAADEADRDGDGTTSRGEWQAHAAGWAREVARAVTLSADGRRIPLEVRQARFRLRAGEAGLSVLLLEAELQGGWPDASRHVVRYRDAFRPEDRGWKEVLVRARPGLSIDGAVARADRSRGLSDYATDGALPQELSAAFSVAGAPLPPRSAQAPAAVVAAVPGPASEPPEAAQPAMATPAVDSLAEGSRGASPWAFFRLGMHHIAIGIDHLAFLLGLLLLSQRAVQLIKLVSAFTVAHSITLILAAADLVSAPGAWVEPAIAFTIAYVGFIAWRRRAAGHGVALAFLFGLIHGFGFAGALAETLGDTAKGAGWIVDLLAFNLGIEAVQLMLVAASVALAACVRQANWRATAHAAASLAVFGSGLVWLALRLAVPAGA